MKIKLNEKENATNVAQKVRLFSQDSNFIKRNSYIKFSINNLICRGCRSSPMVGHSPHKRDLLPRRVPGSIPAAPLHILIIYHLLNKLLIKKQ